MYMYLYHVLIRYDYDGITDRFQICLEIHLRLNIKHLIQHDNKLGTVTEFDIRICLRLQAGSRRLTARMGSVFCVERQINLFTKVGIIYAF